MPGALILSGIAVGAFALTALSVVRSDLRRDTKLTMSLLCVSAAAWTLTGSGMDSSGLGRLLVLLGFPVAGLFWAFVASVFQDRPARPATFAPAAAFLALGAMIIVATPPMQAILITTFNVAAAILCLHAMVLIARGWRGDLIDIRRASRLAVLGCAALFAVAEGAAGALHAIGPGRAWQSFALGEPLGAGAVAGLALALGALFLQARAPLFAPPASRPADPRRTAADRTLLAKLDRFMAAGGWRQEGLSIGALARELGAQEHRLRRLINAQLGHRNFADFVNGYRIEAAKARLSDPSQAEVTIASIAFDLGFGSLSPFNRAFRASTGSTPTVWRRDRLGAADHD